MTAPKLPYSQESEEALLGALISSPTALASLQGKLRVDDFYLVRHKWIYKAMLGIEGEYDYLTISEVLKAEGVLDDAGGLPYLLQLVNNTPSSANAGIYAEVVMRAAMRRRLIEASDTIRQLAIDEGKSLELVREEAGKAFYSVVGDEGTRSYSTVFSDGLGVLFDHIESLMLSDDKSALLGIPTGFRSIDSLLKGLQCGNFYIVAGRPGMGKSSFMQTIALNQALMGKRVLLWSGEMTAQSIILRMAAMHTGINSQRLKGGQLDVQEWQRFVDAQQRLNDLPLVIDETPGITPAQLKGLCYRESSRRGFDVLIVDYLQLMHAPGYEGNRVQEISNISDNLKQIAKEFNKPVLAGAQLNRAVEQRHNKRPMLADLRESGSLEQDTDVVMFLYRDEVYNEATEFPNQADVIVAKHRDGPTDTLMLYFDKAITRFLNATNKGAQL